MIRSMTGFGDAERDLPSGRVRVEIRSVNHRFFNANVKTPSGFDRFEKAISDTLRGHLTRGHVSAFLTIDRSAASVEHSPTVDVEKARGYIEASVGYLLLDEEEVGEPFDIGGQAGVGLEFWSLDVPIRTRLGAGYLRLQELEEEFLVARLTLLLKF